jgi:hypothetical protein
MNYIVYVLIISVSEKMSALFCVVNHVYKIVYDLLPHTYITPWTENYINVRREMNYRKFWAIKKTPWLSSLSCNIYHVLLLYVGDVFLLPLLNNRDI